jgi:hypothetical protein
VPSELSEPRGGLSGFSDSVKRVVITVVPGVGPSELVSVMKEVTTSSSVSGVGWSGFSDSVKMVVITVVPGVGPSELVLVMKEVTTSGGLPESTDIVTVGALGGVSGVSSLIVTVGGTKSVFGGSSIIVTGGGI